MLAHRYLYVFFFNFKNYIFVCFSKRMKINLLTRMIYDFDVKKFEIYILSN